MDERIFQFKAGRPIPDWDWQHRLPLNKPVSSECKDTATVFRINSTYMDVTDQPYKDRQWVGGGVIICCLGSIGSIYCGNSVIQNPNNTIDSYLITMLLLVIGAISGFAYVAFKYGRDEFFALKRRPIRFNRKEKKLYFIRRRRFFAKSGDGDVTWEIPWSKNSIFCIHRGYAEHRPVYHIRHYEVDEDGNVLRAFAIGRKWEEHENLQGLLSQWNYWCWYMNHGPAELPKPPLFFSERESMRESFLFCLYDFGMQPLPPFGTGLALAYLLLIAGFVEFARLAFKYGKDEFFALKRRPIRFNRKEKKIYAIRHRRFGAKPGEGDITWEVPWNDEAIFCIHRRKASYGYVFHIRHYEVDQNGNVIGWAETAHALDRNEYPEGDKKEMQSWSGETDRAANALLWEKDIPPKH